MTASTELEVRWPGGSLDLMGWNETPDGEFEIAALADGTNWGNIEATRRVLRSALLDGSRSTKDRDENRTIPLRLRVSGPNIPAGEQALDILDGLRCELVWRPPAEMGFAPAVFLVDYADLAHVMDDLAYERGELVYTLTLVCHPHAFFDEYVTAPAVPQGVSTPTTVDNGSSATGWSANNGVAVSSVGGFIRATVPAGVTDWTLTRSGDIDFTTQRYLRLTGIPPLITQVRAGTGSTAASGYPRIGSDGGAAIYDVNGTAPGLRFDCHLQTVPDVPMDFDVIDLLEKQATPRSFASRQQNTTIAVPGSRRTSGSLHVASPSGTGLGDVIVYTGPDYNPSMTPWVVPSSGNTRIADSGAISGGLDRFVSGSLTRRYRRPVATFPDGIYDVWLRSQMARRDILTFVANLTKPDGTILDTFNIGSIDLTDVPSGYQILPIASLSLPGWELPPQSTLCLEIAVTSPDLAAPGPSPIDEILLFETTQGPPTIVKAGANTHLWVDAPSIDQDNPLVLVGTSGDKRAARPLSLATDVPSHGGPHILTRGVTNAYVAAGGVAGALTDATFRAAANTHPTRAAG